MPVAVRELSAVDRQLVPELCDLLQDAVHGGASVGFLAPLSQATAKQYWDHVFHSLGDSLRLWIAEEGGAVVGTVQLAPCMKENGLHRAELQKLLVRRDQRGRGLGSALVAAAERAAASSGISLLVLDTLRDSAAEQLYGHLGWQRSGEIPGYAASPDGALHPTVIFYKVIGRKPG